MPSPPARVTQVDRLPRRRLLGLEVAVAATRLARLRGLARLDRDAVSRGLLIERCRSVHTFGMRFELDLIFLDSELKPLGRCNAIGPRRLISHPAARAVLELPSRGGG